MEPETVILVHGLWVHGLAMELMRRRIARQGYRALAYSYPSVRLALAENADRLARFCRDISTTRLHFVGHSLGGLIVLRMLERERGLASGRVVLAGTPYGGSQAAGGLAHFPGGRAALGRSMTEWLGASHGAPDVDRDIGVIAGTLPMGLGRIVKPDLPRPSDGAVSVAETRVAGMKDHIALHVSHSGMLVSSAVAQQACAFLRDGAFRHEKA